MTGFVYSAIHLRHGFGPDHMVRSVESSPRSAEYYCWDQLLLVPRRVRLCYRELSGELKGCHSC